MQTSFAETLTIGGKTNSLGRTSEVIDTVLHNKSRLSELYECLFHGDAWARMRAADALEKICRIHPEWLEDYTDRLLHNFSANTQPSIQWHLAQIYGEVTLSAAQRQKVIAWLEKVLASAEIDWIVASNTMDTLVKFTKNGWITTPEARKFLRIQLGHHSKAVVKRANKLLDELAA